MQIKTSKHGWKYYESQPEGFREASMEDFYDYQGRLIVGKAYLVKSMVTENRYWAHRVNKGFPYPWSDFKIFLESGCVFVVERE